MRVESDGKFEEKLALGFKNDMTNVVNFNASCGKSENLHFDGLLLSMAYIKVQLKKHRQNIRSCLIREYAERPVSGIFYAMSLFGNIWVRENPYCGRFYAVSKKSFV